MQKKIVITGGPGTGKSSLINALIRQGFFCMPEISRKVTLDAQENGIEQLFLEEPLLFSELLLEGREQQFINAEKESDRIVFFDRGIPDVHGYMNYMGIDYPDVYKEKSLFYRYTTILMTPPWQEIYQSDNERYESYEQSLSIHNHLKKTYLELEYSILDVPIGSIKDRVRFILNSVMPQI